MNRNLVGSTYGRFCIKFSQSRMKGEWKFVEGMLNLKTSVNGTDGP